MNNNIIFELISFANHLDEKGLRHEADYIDSIIKSAGVDPEQDEDIDYEEIGVEPPRPEWNRDDYITALCNLSKTRDEEGDSLGEYNAKLQTLVDAHVGRMSEQARRYLEIIRFLKKRKRIYNSDIRRLLAKANRTFGLNIDDIEKGCPEFSTFYKKQD